MNGPNINIICWNVCGLNTPARRTTVHETLTLTTCHLVCLQETKLSNIDQTLACYLGDTTCAVSLKNWSRVREAEFFYCGTTSTST